MKEPAVAWLRGRVEVEVEVEQQHQAQAWESPMTLCDRQASCQDGDEVDESQEQREFIESSSGVGGVEYQATTPAC